MAGFHRGEPGNVGGWSPEVEDSWPIARREKYHCRKPSSTKYLSENPPLLEHTRKTKLD